MSKAKGIVVGTLLAFVSGCGPCRRPQAIIARTAASSAVRAALTSIYYHALSTGSADGRFEPLPVMDIVEAARILREAPSPEADTYRRRAIGMLATTGIPPARIEDLWKPGKVHEALQAIGAPMNELAKAFIAQRAAGGLTDADKQWVAYGVLSQTAGPWGQKCCSCLTDWDVDPDPDPPDGVPMAYFKISVGRSYKDVRPLMDPQSWSSCSPDFFAVTQAIEKGTNATCLSGDPCTANVPPALTPPPNPDSPWKGTLFEHYRNAYSAGSACSGLPGNHGEMYVRNVLRIDKTRNSATARDQIDYGVCGVQPTGAPTGAVDSAIDCDCEVHGVDVDCGQTVTSEAHKNPPVTIVEGVKHLKFSPRAINYDLDKWAVAGLKMMIDEIVEEGVCCGASGTVTCPKCPQPVLAEDPPLPTIALCNP